MVSLDALLFELGVLALYFAMFSAVLVVVILVVFKVIRRHRLNPTLAQVF